jgi:hypothetical protein
MVALILGSDPFVVSLSFLPSAIGLLKEIRAGSRPPPPERNPITS